MNENLREELGIDDWLELVKEDRNLCGAYVSFAQYIDKLQQENQQLKEQLKQRDEVIEETINKIEDLRMEKWAIQGADIMILLDILQKYKGDNNEVK